MNVNHPGGVESILGGQRTGDERNAAEKAGIEFLTEAGDAFRNQDIVDAVLEIGVLAADMELAERIFGHPGCA